MEICGRCCSRDRWPAQWLEECPNNGCSTPITRREPQEELDGSPLTTWVQWFHGCWCPMPYGSLCRLRRLSQGLFICCLQRIGDNSGWRRDYPIIWLNPLVSRCCSTTTPIGVTIGVEVPSSVTICTCLDGLVPWIAGSLHILFGKESNGPLTIMSWFKWIISKMVTILNLI